MHHSPFRKEELSGKGEENPTIYCVNKEVYQSIERYKLMSKSELKNKRDEQLEQQVSNALRLICGCDHNCFFYMERSMEEPGSYLVHLYRGRPSTEERILIDDLSLAFNIGNTKLSRQILMTIDLQHQEWEDLGYRKETEPIFSSGATASPTKPEPDVGVSRAKCSTHNEILPCKICLLVNTTITTVTTDRTTPLYPEEAELPYATNRSTSYATNLFKFITQI